MQEVNFLMFGENKSHIIAITIYKAVLYFVIIIANSYANHIPIQCYIWGEHERLASRHLARHLREKSEPALAQPLCSCKPYNYGGIVIK